MMKRFFQWLLFGGPWGDIGWRFWRWRVAWRRCEICRRWCNELLDVRVRYFSFDGARIQTCSPKCRGQLES